MKVIIYLDGKHDTVEVKEKIRSTLPEARYMIFDSAEEIPQKQIPQKPLWVDNVPHSRCPVCDNVVAPYIDSPKLPYCYWCGQKLKWGEEE